MNSNRLSAGGALLAAGLGLATLTSLVSTTLAEEPDYRYLIRLEENSFVPDAGDLNAGIDYLAANTDRGSVHVLVQLDEVPARSEREGLAAQGLLLQGYVPENTFYALVSTDISAAELQNMGVRWMGPLDDRMKISERMRDGRYLEDSALPDGQRAFVVQFHDDVDKSTAQRLVLDVGGKLGDWMPALTTQIAGLDPVRLNTLAAMDEIKYIASVPPRLTGVNNSVRSAMNVDTVHQAPYNLSGIGTNVLVYDVGPVDTNHADFGGRAWNGEGGGSAGHSTHVAGTVAGAGTASGGTYKGMAPGAEVTSYTYESCSPNCLYNSPQDIAENYEEGWSQYGTDYSTNSLGANIPTNGYPCDWTGDYELTAQLLDAIAVGEVFSAKFLSLWAAGNDRQSSRCGSSYETMGVPATAKNPIVVGATNSNDHSITWFTGFGPTDDGRVRPDITAPGCQSNDDGGVTSTVPGGGYGVSCGTSMATPAVAGVVALLREQARRSIGFPVLPLPSLIKVLLVNSAHDYGNPGPDYQYGFGEVEVDVLIDRLRDGSFYTQGSIDQGGTTSYNLNVQSLSELKVSVAWDDVPGELLAAKELVNDLDLTLESPSGTMYEPWILNPNNPGSNATRGADHLNNVEQVTVDNPEDGVWTVHIDGFLVPEGPQSFSVAANARRAQDTTDAPDLEESSSDVGVRDLASYPNPFLPRTTLRFRSDGAAPVNVEIFDTSGRAVRTLIAGENRPAGLHFVTWDGTDNSGDRLPGGVYFYQVRSGEQSDARKVLMLD